MTGSLEHNESRVAYQVNRQYRAGHPVFGGVAPDRNPLDSVHDFEGFISMAYGSVCALARAWGRDFDQCADVAQETMTRIWAAWVRDGDSGIWTLPYARTVVRNFMRDESKKKSPHVVDDSVLEGLIGESWDTYREGLDPDVEKVLAELPERQRQVVEMTVVSGLTTAEASTALKLASGTVHRYRSLAFAAMRERLSRHPR